MKNNAGFTLIEVLVALAIISISLTAIIKATTQNIRDTFYLQNKMVAHWIALNEMNEARAGLIKLPSGQQNTKEEITMLNQQWQWQGYTTNTKNPKIKEIHISVYLPDHETPLASVTSYSYVQK